MPGHARDIMSLRHEFCVLADQPGANKSELCRRYKVCRKTGRKWLTRFREAGVDWLVEQSRRPHTSPTAMHCSTIVSKKRRKTSTPYRSRIRVRLE